VSAAAKSAGPAKATRRRPSVRGSETKVTLAGLEGVLRRTRYERVLPENMPLEAVLAHALGSELTPLDGLIGELAFVAKALQNRCDAVAGSNIIPDLNEVEAGARLLESKAQAVVALVEHLRARDT
jgi:hypothetical protein